MESIMRNKEKYLDITAGVAICNAERKQKRKFRPLIYVCSRYAGDVSVNTAAAVRYCQFVIEQGGIPIASHLLYPQILDDRDKEQRELGLFFGMVLLDVCREIWIFTDGELSEGMEMEYTRARRMRYRIRWFNEQMEETGQREK